MNAAVNRYISPIACAVAVLSSLILLPRLNDGLHGDLVLYGSVSADLLEGILPYRDRVLEYPPYAIPVFLFPRIFGENNYSTAFMCLVLFADWSLKASLFALGSRCSKGIRAYFPLLGYSLAIPFLSHFFLQRYDVWPAFVSLLGIWLFYSGRLTSSGLCFAIGAGMKLYPVVFLPPLFLLALREGKLSRFVAGIMAGLLPILLLSLYLPWWRFAEFHGMRGIQCESIVAALLWLTKLCGLTQLDWVFTKAWFEVHGASATALLPAARAIFAWGVLGSVAFASCAAVCIERPSLGRLARLLLIPLLGFIAFNLVLSPQYMVWLLPIAAICLIEGSLAAPVMLILATVITPIIYPSLTGNYGHGLNVTETLVLVIRDFMLIIAWMLLILEFVPLVRQRGTPLLREILTKILSRPDVERQKRMPNPMNLSRSCRHH